jgi:serine/threonine-protein kinase
VKITDFGIAKLLDAQGVTSTGQVLGSPAHMAPEQIEGGDVNARSDVFGLGVLLYEAMVGRLPFDGKNPAQVLRRVLDGAFTPADKARPTVGARFSAIVGRALSHDPAGRYASAADLSAALRDELAALGFHDVRGELSAFLSGPEGFRETYESRVVAELVRRAAEARKERDIPLSAACLNRALAFRPDDADLLAEVSSLGRAQRLRRNLVSAGIALGGSALLAAAGFAAVTFGGELATGAKGAPSAAVPLRPKQPAKVPEVAGSSSPGSRIAEILRPGARKKPKAPLRPAPGVEPDRALVKIIVDGPQNAIVRLDGVELKDWFGPPREITVGPHSFEFDPRSPECCEPGQRLTVNIRAPNAPGEEQLVRGKIPFKPAVLELTGTPGSTASCGVLGTFPVPSRQSFPMIKPALAIRCTILPPPGSSVPPKEFDGTLSPGRVFRNPGP